MWSYKSCRNLIGICPFWWLAHYFAPFRSTALIRCGETQASNCRVQWTGASIPLSQEEVIIWGILKKWVFTNIYILAHIKWGFKCLTSNMFIKGRKYRKRKRIKDSSTIKLIRKLVHKIWALLEGMKCCSQCFKFNSRDSFNLSMKPNISVTMHSSVHCWNFINIQQFFP